MCKQTTCPRIGVDFMYEHRNRPPSSRMEGDASFLRAITGSKRAILESENATITEFRFFFGREITEFCYKLKMIQILNSGLQTINGDALKQIAKHYLSRCFNNALTQQAFPFHRPEKRLVCDIPLV